jgi:hypothetical protein
MMLNARIGKEVVVRVHNEIGVVAQMTRLIADKGINILAVNGWVEGQDAVVRFVTSDNLRVMDALRERKYNPNEKDVVLTEAGHKAGMLRHITDTLAREGIDLHHVYASASPQQDKCLIVFACANNDRAVVLLA